MKYPFWRIDKERNIQIIENGGWHFSYLLTPQEIEKKFKSLAETSWDNEKFSNLDIIKQKNIENIKNLGVDYIEVTLNPVIRKKINKLK